MTDYDDAEAIRAALLVANAKCDVQSASIESYDDRELTIRLSEDGLREYIRELRLAEHSEQAQEWLDSRDSNGA